MVDELIIYARDTGLFNQVTDTTNIVKYHVSPNYGADLNTNNLDAFLKDPAYGLTDVKQKYPICVCITPKSRRIKINGIVWEEFFFTLYFLERTYHDGQNKIKKLDKDTQTSQAQPYDSWANMKKEANLFLSSLEATLRSTAVVENKTVPFRSFLYGDFNSVDIRRLSKVQNDNISGIEVNFNLYLNIDLCITSSQLTYTVEQFQNETDPVWLSEKSNYYTKAEIDALNINNLTIVGETIISVVEGASYKTTLTDVLSLTVLSSVHGISNVSGITVLDTLNENFNVKYRIETNGDVYIESNVSLLNHTLIIF